MLRIRTISSTFLGHGGDSAIFIKLAFWGMIPASVTGSAVVNQWLFKSVYEAIATPFTYMIVNYLKRTEQQDYYDHETNFNPIRF
jgi:hypothetical protein